MKSKIFKNTTPFLQSSNKLITVISGTPKKKQKTMIVPYGQN